MGERLPSGIVFVGEARLESAPSWILRRTLCVLLRHCGKRMRRVRLVRTLRCTRCARTATFYWREDMISFPIADCRVCGYVKYDCAGEAGWS